MTKLFFLDLIEERIHICRQLVKSLSLDLRDLIVITECASGDYSYTPIIAALAGAKVFAVGKDTSFGTHKGNKRNIEKILLKCSESARSIEFGTLTDFDQWDHADIITNSGMIRPFDEFRIQKLKKTAVIPLMWETWEFRREEIDIAACQSRHIIVLGTNEEFEAINMYGYPGLMAMKLILDLKVDIFKETVVVLGGGLTGSLVTRFLRKLSADILWYVSDIECGSRENLPYTKLPKLIDEDNIGLIIVSEHTTDVELIGENGYLSFYALARKFPFLKIGHICGNIDASSLENSKLRHRPNHISRYGYMSFLPDVVSPWPVLSLNAGGLKVGEILARARKKGATVDEAIDLAVKHGIGQDFRGGFMNYRP